MIRSFRVASVACGVALLAASALSQEGGQGEGPKPASPPADAPKAELPELLNTMERHFGIVVRRPNSALPDDAPKELQVERARRQKAWEDAVRGLAKTSDAYMAALAGATPEPRALYLRGVGKTQAAGIGDKNARQATYREGADALKQYLQLVDAKDPLRADAEMHLGQALVLAAGDDASGVDEAVAHLRAAIDVFQKEGRHDDAGQAAFYVLSMLRGVGREDALAQFAADIKAAEADFGTSTPTVRNYAAGARIAVGAPLPEMPAVKDVDDQPVSFAGGPLLVHFFQTAEPGTGRTMQFREVDTEVAPLWEKHHAKGLRVVGVCLDYAMPAAEAEAKRKEWTDVIGRKGEFRDGSVAQAREWASKNGVAWPWTASGRWFEDPVAKAFGGVGSVTLRVPYAVLTDKDGVVRWKGSAPFLGLPEAVAKAVE